MIEAFIICLVEAVLHCHCAQFVHTDNGLRCAVYQQRCELVSGSHWIVYQEIEVCSRGCE